MDLFTETTPLTPQVPAEDSRHAYFMKQALLMVGTFLFP